MTLKLTKALKAKIVEQFKSGEGIEKIASWYSKSPIVIEGVIREAMLEPPPAVVLPRGLAPDVPKNNGVPTHQEVTAFVEQFKTGEEKAAWADPKVP